MNITEKQIVGRFLDELSPKLKVLVLDRRARGNPVRATEQQARHRTDRPILSENTLSGRFDDTFGASLRTQEDERLRAQTPPSAYWMVQGDGYSTYVRSKT